MDELDERAFIAALTDGINRLAPDLRPPKFTTTDVAMLVAAAKRAARAPADRATANRQEG